MVELDDNSITYFARTNFRNEGRPFGIHQVDRRSHMLLLGKTGTGKTSCLETMARQDLKAGRGFAYLDPHGDSVERLAQCIPSDRQDDLIYFDIPRKWRTLGFNPLSGVPRGKEALAVSAIVEVFKQQWSDFHGPRLEHVLRNALMVLIKQPHATLADILSLFHDREYRRQALTRVTNKYVRSYWQREFMQYSPRFRSVVIAPIQNKVSAYLTQPVLGCILTRSKSTANLRYMMDARKILLVNLAKGKIGHDVSNLLGSLFLSLMGITAIRRSDMPETERVDFAIFADEFANFTTSSLADMAPELRKYRVGMVLAQQTLSALDQKIRESIIGNAGSIIAFRVGALDANLLAREFAPVFSATDLIQLPRFSIYLKLLINNSVSRPFSATTLAPGELASDGRRTI